MTEIYDEISKLSPKFRGIAKRFTNDKNKVDECVQELMLYFLQMNKDTLKSIYIKDGLDGVIRYGAVALRRALTSKRSNFWYKYEKYYTNLDSYSLYITNTDNYISEDNQAKHLYNLPNEEVPIYKWKQLEKIDNALDELSWYDRQIFKLYYYEGNTLDGLAEKTRISRNSLFTTIDKVRDILKKSLNE
tara:strand:+ start:5219 stop:5785 length:567 start_codon:yes stop_codon:yes gene_type:complete